MNELTFRLAYGDVLLIIKDILLCNACGKMHPPKGNVWSEILSKRKYGIGHDIIGSEYTKNTFYLLFRILLLLSEY